MRRKLTSYEDLLIRAEFLNLELNRLGIWSNKKHGRFQSYIKTVKALNAALKNGTSDVFLSKYNRDGSIMFVLKQLYELTYILDHTLKEVKSKSAEDVKEIIDKIYRSLSGPIHPRDENANNNSPRNNQFELLVFSRLSASGFTDIQMLKNPDILPVVKNRKYPIECKRVIGLTEQTILQTVENAVDQITDNWKDEYLGGVVALDLSVKYEQGSQILDGGSHMSAEDYVQNQLLQDFGLIHSRCTKIVEAAKNNKIVGIMLNVSCVYTIRSIMEMGWMNELALGVFNRENLLRSQIFQDDFKNLKQSQMGLRA